MHTTRSPCALGLGRVEVEDLECSAVVAARELRLQASDKQHGHRHTDKQTHNHGEETNEGVAKGGGAGGEPKGVGVTARTSKAEPTTSEPSV